MRIETPAQACAALAALIAGADEVGTMEESRFLYETVAAMPVFADLDRVAFTELMHTTTDWVWAEFPTLGGRVTDEGVTDLLGLICDALPPELRSEAFRAAVGLARADGVTSEEELLLQRVCEGLEIDPRTATEFFDPGA